MRRAEFSVGYAYIIGGIIAGLIAVAYFTGVLPWVLDKVGLVELIPVLGLTAPVQGNGVVGVNIATGNLEYYTGESFKKFTGQEVALLGGYEFNISDVQEKISDFYFGTTRRPEKLSLSLNSWRYWEATKLPNDLIKVNSLVKDYLIRSGQFSPNAVEINGEFVNLRNDEFIINSLDERSGFRDFVQSQNGQYNPLFANIEVKMYPGKVDEIIAWRDSILQGNKCEKFLTLRLKKENEEKDVTYAVRKVDGYLVIDLTKPIDSGNIEKWKDEKCFGVDSYNSNEQVNLAPLGIHFAYQEKNVDFEGADHSEPTLKYTGKEGGWYYYGKNPEAAYYYNILDIKKSLYDNLIQITQPKKIIGQGWFGTDKYDDGGLFEKYDVLFKSGDSRQGVFIVNGVYIKDRIGTLDTGFIRDKEWSKLTINERNKFIYDLLNEFYRLSLLEGEPNA